MIHHERYDDAPDKNKLSTEDTLWIVSGVIISLSLLAVIYSALSLFTSF